LFREARPRHIQCVVARLDRSLAQLRDPRLSGIAIGEIASRAGFASQESFTRAFRQRFGSPPGAHRAKREA